MQCCQYFFFSTLKSWHWFNTYLPAYKTYISFFSFLFFTETYIYNHLIPWPPLLIWIQGLPGVVFQIPLDSFISMEEGVCEVTCNIVELTAYEGRYHSIDADCVLRRKISSSMFLFLNVWFSTDYYLDLFIVKMWKMIRSNYGSSLVCLRCK